MNYRVILVHIDDTPRAPLRLDVALRLAKAHAAQLVGVYLVPGIDLMTFPRRDDPARGHREAARG